ncbi:MAG: BNR-4 repeat-containing protein [Candidatus Symbiothrix sp.]|jgi:hypothetical protein|nr:BNR-4 repeat-containing protein [Candidatus Symbiothrix sp.]
MTKNILSLAIFCSLCAFTANAADPVRFVRVGETNPNSNVYLLSTSEQLSGQAFQQDMLLTYKGYQYTVYYNNTRNVCLSRRKLPLGEWHELVFPYQNSADDSHNVISLGICAKDGTIHLSYDHHNSPLHYCRSVEGLANQPATMKWTTANFSETTNILVPGVAVPDVTYPRFISKPDGNLLFECRYKLSGDGDSYLREYDGATHTWSLIGRYVQGMDANPNACAYINRMDYDNLGRLHVSWCWRDDYGGGSNHDIFYGYSTDDGRTWRNNAGEQVAVTENQYTTPTDSRAHGECMRQELSSLQIATIGYNRGYINQESQSSDQQGRVHILNSYMPDGTGTDSNWDNSRLKARLHHRFRKTDGTWAVNQVKNNGSQVYSYCRSQVVCDKFDNAWVIANGAEIYAATAAADYSDWNLMTDVDKNRFCSEPQVDHPRLLNDGVLSFVYVGRDKKVAVIDYLLDNPHTPDGTGLNSKGSGVLETIYGEQYTLYLQTACPTDVYVDGKLLIQKTTDTSEEISASIPLIASHKHNISIKTTTNAAIPCPYTLSWSSAHTPKTTVPLTSLYPDEENQDDADEPYPYSPDLPELQNFGGASVNVSSFEPSVGDFTLEVTTSGIAPIVIGSNYLSYTPTEAGTVRFAQKDGVVYVYENGKYQLALTPQLAMSFPDIFSAADDSTAKTGIYDPKNLFRNPGFEQVATYISGYDPVSRPTDIRSKAAEWNTLDSYYGTGSRTNNLTVNSGYAALLPLIEGDYAFMLHGYGEGDEGASLWQELYGMQPATAYLLRFRHMSHKDTSPQGAGYKVRFGDFFTDFFAEYNYTNPVQGFGNYTDAGFSFVTPTTLPAHVYFFVSRGATCIAHFDRMTLIEGSYTTGAGISGISSALYLEGTAYAPSSVQTAIVPVEKNIDALQIYSDRHSLRIDNPTRQTANIRIYDLLGKHIAQHTSTQQHLSIPLSAGIYIVQLQFSDSFSCKKIVIP